MAGSRRARGPAWPQCLALFCALDAEPTSHRGRFELDWQAPPQCPGADEGRARVVRFLGRGVGAPQDPDVRARVVLRARDQGFVAGITLDDSGERELTAERCDIVAEAAAYVVAAWIDPSVEPPTESTEPSEPTEPTGPIEPESPIAARLPTEPALPKPIARPRRAAVRGGVRLGAAVGVGALPSAAPGLAVGGAVLLRRVRFELAFTQWFTRPARLDARPDIGGDIRLATGAARVCPVVVLRPIEVPLCGGFEIGSMRGRGVGIEQPARTRLLWAAFTAAAGVVWMPSRWVGPWLDAALVVPVSRPIFEAENVGRVHQPAPVAFAGMLGVEARFP